MSVNTTTHQNIMARHFFVPNLLNFFLEILVAVVVLTLLNFLTFEKFLLHGYPANLTPSSYGVVFLDNFLSFMSSFQLSGDILIFVLWAVIGMLVYLFCFRLFQIVYGVSSSLGQGFRYIKDTPDSGLKLWLNSLHDFFLKVTTYGISFGLLVVAVFFIFTLATWQVHQALTQHWPSSTLALTASLVLTIIGIRLVVMTICLLLPRFARWYLA